MVGWRIIGHIADRLHLERWGRQDRWLAVLFHHITDDSKWRADDPLIRGLNRDITVDAFTDRIRWLSDRYEFISLDSVLAPASVSTKRPKLLLCFDDGYASVVELAAPILRDFSLPWCFFINPRFVGNSVLPVDNIISYIANVYGTNPLSNLAGRSVGTAREFIGDYLSRMPPEKRGRVVQDLAAKLDFDTASMARTRRLFVEEYHIRSLSESGVEIGSHTVDHVHCRTLDSASAVDQIEAGAREVARMSGREVRAFAYPYGSMTDVTAIARRAVQNSGHKCAFVVHNRANSRRTDQYALYRLDLGEMDHKRAMLELEVLPRMRAALAGIRGGFRP